MRDITCSYATMAVTTRLPGLVFERPAKGDLDRSLSLLMHEHRHKLIDQVNAIKSDAIKLGALQSNRLIIACVKAADALHQDAMKQAAAILFDFIGRMQLPPTEITGWARPHLENLGDSLLGAVPPNGFPADYERIRTQYEAVFTQRLSGVLRDVEIGFTKGAGFARAEKMESTDEWITAAEAVNLLRPVCGSSSSAQMSICKRAYAGLIRSRADKFIIDDEDPHVNLDIPKEFWWAEGHEALKQDWALGDFETWENHEIRYRAFGVKFARSDIEKMTPSTSASAPAAIVSAPVATASKGGRPPAEYWDDLWVEICRQLYAGELIPKRQSDVESAMKAWLARRDDHPATSTIRERARKLWAALDKDEN